MHFTDTPKPLRERVQFTQWTSTAGIGSDITNSAYKHIWKPFTHTHTHTHTYTYALVYDILPSWTQGVGSEAWTVTFYGYLHPVLLLWLQS